MGSSPLAQEGMAWLGLQLASRDRELTGDWDTPVLLAPATAALCRGLSCPLCHRKDVGQGGWSDV